MSVLGTAASPLATEMSAWWILLGGLLLWFAVGFRKTFAAYGKPVRRASELIGLYAAGEGIGSGIFPANRVDGVLTPLGYMHNAVSGIGVIGLMLIPVVLLPLFPKACFPRMHSFTWGVLVLGTSAIVLFLTSRSVPAWAYEGLWQRLFTAVYYLYLVVLAYFMRDGTQNGHPVPV